LPPRARFCLECGAQLAGGEAREEPGTAAARALRRLAPREFADRLLATRDQVSKERRVVTMLFSDVKGSTTMAEGLDPEEVTEIMEGAFDVLIEPITRYDGALARLMGDGILAFFGAPIAHEDDAERACRAALDIISGAEEYAARLEEERGISGFSVRVGIHTGLVVVGEVGSDLRVEYTAMGDAVNTASRMETAAEPGTVLITEDTHRLIAPLFETQALGSIEVKGKTEPVSAHRVLALRTVLGKPRGIPGLESPLVGRDAEFRALWEALERLQAGIGGIVTVVGEAGIGKSRLVAELRKAAAPLGVRWVEGRCLSYGESMAYRPWVDMLHGLLGEPAQGAPDIVRGALRRLIERLCPDHVDEVYPYLGRMMSLPLEEQVEARLRTIGPEGLKVLTFRAVGRVVGSVARSRPLVLVCEDLHWADPTSLELVEEVLSLTDQASLLLVCAFRPYTEHGSWAVRETVARVWRHRHTDVWLEPLSAADSERLVGNLLEVEALPRPLRERILDHAEGNPFYVEEVIRSLIDAEAIVQDEVTGYWQAMRSVEDIAIPDTLQGVLMARIDRLDEGARRVLRLASVIGRIFPQRALVAIAGEESELGRCLSTLQREEMIRERRRVPELEYIFKHHLTQQAAYNGLLRRERRRLHRQVAEVLEELFPNRIDEQLGLLAHHWEQAGEGNRAIEYLRRAGEQAASQFAGAEAVDYFSRALDLTPEDDLAARYSVLLAREDVRDLQGAREAQLLDLTTLKTLAEAMEYDGKRAQVALLEARYGIETGNYEAALVAAQEAISLAQTAQSVAIEAAAQLRWGQALWDNGDYDGARARVERGLDLARAARLCQEEADSLHHLGYVDLYQGDWGGMAAHYGQALLIYREIGDGRGQSSALMGLGRAHLYQGEYDDARAYLRLALDISREIGARRYEGGVLYSLGSLYRHLGDYDEAMAHYEQSLQLQRETVHTRGEGNVLALLGALSHQLGDNKAAEEHCRQALLVGQDTTDRWVQAWALSGLGQALEGLDRLREAADAYQEALILRRSMREPHLATEPLAGLARMSLAQGDLPQARAYVEEILDYLETGKLVVVWGAEPGLVYLTCYRVLEANGDARAQGILREAHRFVQERAAKISDEGERRSYLENVAVHREIVNEYASGGHV